MPHILETIFMRSEAGGLSWVRSNLEHDDLGALEDAFRAARRRLPDRPWCPTGDAHAALVENKLAWTTVGLGLPDVAAGLFFVRASTIAHNPQPLVACWYDTSDERGRRVILRALSLVPNARAHVGVARRALRCNVRATFESLCFENPYPSIYFPDAVFEQMVDRARMQQGSFELHRIIGLVERQQATPCRTARAWGARSPH